MLPIVSIVGAKKSGKTTVVAALVKELSARGMQVATAKRCHQEFQVDREGTDSWQHAQAGAVVVALRGPEEFAVIGRGKAPSFRRLAAFLLEEADLLIAEGFAAEDLPKIEVVRKDAPIHPPERLTAIVTDVPLALHLPTFGFDEMGGLADFIEARYCVSPSEVNLVVEGEPVPLNRFTDSFISGTVRGMLSSLREIPEGPRNISLQIRTPSP